MQNFSAFNVPRGIEMNKLIAALIATVFAAGAAFAQAPAPQQPGQTLEKSFASPAQKSEVKKTEKKQVKKAKKVKKTKKAKKAKKVNKHKKAHKKSSAKKAPRKSVSDQ
jgi:heme/copper-type cytochrome/quinol oxidase subunit 1